MSEAEVRPGIHHVHFGLERIADTTLWGHGILRDEGYEGWLVVEAEQDPAVAPSYTYAEKGYRALRGIVDAFARKAA